MVCSSIFIIPGKLIITTCPVFPGRTKVVHVGFDDPPKLAKEAPSEEVALDCYRRVRDEIKSYVQTLPESLKGPAS